MGITIKDLLLIEEPAVLILKDELLKVASWFVLPSFVIALCFEYFSELKFGEVVKKLILILSFIGCFYTFHTKAVDLSFQGSEELLKKVSPRNIFLKNWAEVKVRTKENENWSMLEKFAIPNVNDLLGTFFFVISKLFIWILKLIYTTVYHLTYIFAPITAVLYFFPVTKNSISGTIQSSLWCILMPFVLISILAIVGNSIQAPAANGKLSIVTIDQILWLSGVTLLLLMSPVITIGLLRGGGVAMSGSAIGVLMSNAGMKVLNAAPALAGGIGAASKHASKVGKKALFEPSIKDLLKKENANSHYNKRKGLVDKNGGIKNPLKGPTSINDRLEKIGMTKNEALTISRMPKTNEFGEHGKDIKGQLKNEKSVSPKQEQETFLYDKSFWNKISPEHQAGIKAKYGIRGDTPIANKLYHPISQSGRLDSKNVRNVDKSTRSSHLNGKREIPKLTKKQNTMDLK